MALSTFSFALVFLFSLWTTYSCMSKLPTTSTDESSQTADKEYSSIRGHPAQMYSLEVNENEKLLRHTRDVVKMNSLPRIDPVKVS